MTSDDIEWYPIDGVGTTGNVHVDGPAAEPGGRFGIAAIVGIALVVFFGLWAIQTTGDLEAASSPTPTAAPTTTPGPEEATAVGPEAALLRELTGLTLFVTQHDGGPPQRRRTTDRGELAITDELDGLRDFSVDVSGQWFAAVSDSTTMRGAQVLWVGATNGEPGPIGVEVRGYAWHDTEPGTIAFATGRPGDDGARMVSIDFRRVQPRTAEFGTTTGWLDSWGDWGYAVRSQRVGSHLDVHDANGALIIDSYRGTAAGWIPGSGLLVTPWGSRRQPQLIGPGESEPTTVSWLEDFQHVWNLAASPNPSLTRVAVQATNFDEDRHEVIVVDLTAKPEVIERIPSVGGSAALAWTLDGESLFFVREDHRTQTDLVIYEPGSDTTDAVALTSLRPEDSWTRALAVPN